MKKAKKKIEVKKHKKTKHVKKVKVKSTKKTSSKKSIATPDKKHIVLSTRKIEESVLGVKKKKRRTSSRILRSKVPSVQFKKNTTLIPVGSLKEGDFFAWIDAGGERDKEFIWYRVVLNAPNHKTITYIYGELCPGVTDEMTSMMGRTGWLFKDIEVLQLFPKKDVPILSFDSNETK